MGKAVIVAGIGSRKGSTSAAITDAIGSALAAHGLAFDALTKLATGEIKRNEPGILAAAEALNLPLVIVGDDELGNASGKCLTQSGRSIEATGTASLSEAAALAAAGERGKLLGARIALEGVTCALACSEGDV